jgi:hypothetical protein
MMVIRTPAKTKTKVYGILSLLDSTAAKKANNRNAATISSIFGARTIAYPLVNFAKLVSNSSKTLINLSRRKQKVVATQEIKTLAKLLDFDLYGLGLYRRQRRLMFQLCA